MNRKRPPRRKRLDPPPEGWRLIHEARKQALDAWQEAWWAKVPHTQLAWPGQSSRANDIRWYWG